MGERLCQCLTCGRMHPAMGFTGFPRTDDEKRIKAIAERVRPTIGSTFSSRGETIEGRISKADFDTLMASWMAWKFTAKCEQAWQEAIPEQKAKIEAEVHADFMQEHAEMLAALKDLVEAFRNPGDGGEFEDGEVPQLDAARAIIAKAEHRE